MPAQQPQNRLFTWFCISLCVHVLALALWLAIPTSVTTAPRPLWVALPVPSAAQTAPPSFQTSAKTALPLSRAVASRPAQTLEQSGPTAPAKAAAVATTLHPEELTESAAPITGESAGTIDDPEPATTAAIFGTAGTETGAEPIAPSTFATISNARPQRALRLSYPEEAVRNNWQGEVGLSIRIDADGAVGAVTVEQSSGIPLLDSNARNAARRWLFTPARRDGCPVAQTLHIPVVFRLRPGSGQPTVLLAAATHDPASP